MRYHVIEFVNEKDYGVIAETDNYDYAKHIVDICGHSITPPVIKIELYDAEEDEIIYEKRRCIA